MSTATATLISPSMLVVDKNTCVDLECSICYKPINKTFFECVAPCFKVFHVSCMEKIIEKTEEAAWDADEEEPDHKCCYCRRSMNMEMYCLQRLARRLYTLKAGGYEVSDALNQVNEQIANGAEDEDSEYSIYELRDDSKIKKPKQSKRADYKKNPKQQQRRIIIKQNIGGRRR